MCSDISSPIASPRISFSHDLKELDFVPVESHNSRSDALLLNSSTDFDFCIDRSFPQEISSADELFANGRILPVEIKKINPPKQAPRKNNELRDENTKKKRLIEFLSTSFEADEEEEKPMAKTFWQFRRSSSVNSDGKSMANGLIGRSIQFLTRSNSTGSVPNPKPSGVSKVMRKQQSLKESSINRRNSSASAFNHYYPYNNSNNSKKPFLRTSSSRSYGNGVRIINPVLNIPPTYIAKGTVSLFGIGSFFCSKKSKKKRK